MPCLHGGRPDGGEGHPRPFLDEAFLGAEGCYRPFGIEASRRLQPVGDVGAPLLAQGPGDGAGMLGRHRCEAEFVLDDSADLLPPGVVPGEVDDAPVSADEAVDAVLVAASVLFVLGPAVGLPGEAELPLEQQPPASPGAGVVLDARVRITMDVINRLIRPAAEAQRHELAHLSNEIGGPQPPRGEHDDLVVFGLGQVPG
ncbi:hypothetical protein ASF57_18820 [Methylobacterium sp. Leaf117]|nr:hypothetical protein ASF57_18820 [Methylobacterium sp. Leaf117]